MIVIIAVIVVLMLALFFVNQYKNNRAMDSNENPYDKENLKQSTIDQLNDPNYQNQITPDKLAKKLDDKENITVYFYSPECIHCQRTTPILVPLAKDLDVDIEKLNLLEYEDQWDQYGITGTPTLVRFENGKEVARIEGEQDKSSLKTFLEQEVLHE
ncbi:thioredoxin family protein [Virgibacillus sp. 179-BFC.A HS]|uniref:Thioredoxin family protein n=1 Tax=Tigheibacillus jepli TaxID=3035914 RepID=A0ABU5CJX8_9BACI|nr:thioredoxin family protein [Virgibacillus sp. 179-BFC.A HS]MDY0406226.1 thioredoxin family protein [Virgibacillus sp. 179-BFC.A HS]